MNDIKLKSRGRKKGCDYLGKRKPEDRSTITFYVSKEMKELFNIAKSKGISVGYIIDEILRSNVRTTKLADGGYMHSLVMNKVEVSSTTNNLPKIPSGMA
jgi:hypothetical protein